MVTMRTDQPLDGINVEALRAKTLAGARLQKEYMRQLMDNNAFNFLVEEIEKQMKQRRNELLQIPSSVDDMVKKTYALGEMAGLQLAIDLPTVLLDYAQSSIDSAKYREEEQQEQKDGEKSSYYADGLEDEVELGGFGAP